MPACAREGTHSSTCLGMSKVMSPHGTGWVGIPEDLRGSHSRDPWNNSEALEVLAEMLSCGQKSRVRNPPSTLSELLFVASRNQGVWAVSTHVA